MNDAFDFVIVVNDWKISEARFVELVKHERTEDIFGVDKNHFRFRYHEIADFAVVKIHNGGDSGTILAAKNGLWRALQNADKIL